MDHRIKIKSSFVNETIHKEFYTGGNVQLSEDGLLLLCQCRNYITVVNINSGTTIQTIPPKSDELCEDDDNFTDDVLTFTASNTSDLLSTVHKSGLIKLWNWREGTILKSWKSVHKGPIAKLAFNRNNSYLATGGTDSSVRVWEIDSMSSVAKLGELQGVTSILTYHTVNNEELLFASGNEAKIFVWSFHGDMNKQLIFKLSGHFSIITSVMFSNDGLYLISCGRDKVVIIWNLKTGAQVRTLPLYESIEAGVILPDSVHLPGRNEADSGVLIAVGGELGSVRFWNAIKGVELYRSSVEKKRDQNALVHLIYQRESNCLISVNVEQNILLNDINEQFSVRKQLIGCNDEIFDIVSIGKDESYIAVAVNSCNISLYDENMNCSLLKGHTDLVISLASSRVNPNLLVSASKDNTIRIWILEENIVRCVGFGITHTASVCAVDISKLSSERIFIVSAGEDMTVKLWNFNDSKPSKPEEMYIPTKTQIAHEKAINSVAISPNNKLIATASQDKTAKLWSSDQLALIGTLRGHRRGLWYIKFSPVDQVLLTSSTDGTLRLWSVIDCTCLKTFEGHESSVLKFTFINKGIQIISCCSDGLIKVWLIKTGECISTLDKHTGKVWAINVKSDESRIISGGSDSRLIIWRDNTEEELRKETENKKQLIEQEQNLSNLLHADQLLPALELTLTLNRPGQALKIIETILSKNDTIFEELLKKLDTNQKETLINYACTWNTNSKHCYAAQFIFSTMKRDILDGRVNLSEKLLEGALAYTDRHLKRINKLFQDIQFVEFTERIMQPHMSSQKETLRS